MPYLFVSVQTDKGLNLLIVLRSGSKVLSSAMLLISAMGHGHIFMRASGENRNWPIRRLVTNALQRSYYDRTR